MRARVAAALLALLALGACQSTSIWSRKAQSDLGFIHQQLIDNHPGAVDPDPANSWFRAWLNPGYEEALERARQAGDYAGYTYALRFYTAGFQDGHISIRLHPERLPTAWPGFLVIRESGTWRVTQALAEPGLPTNDDVLLSCDGAASDELASRILQPYAPVYSISSQRRRNSIRLLADEGNPFARPPRACRFSSGGTEHEVALHYRPIARGALDAAFTAALGTYRPPLEAREFRPKSWWISIPSFGRPDKDMQALLDSVTANAKAIRKARVIVFDMRGNGGGASTWGDRMVAAIWGADYTASIEPVAHAVDWRVCDDTIKYFQETILPLFRKRFGENDRSYQAYVRLTDAMVAARARGQTFVRQDEAEFYPPVPTGTVAPIPVAAKVYLLTDSICASACLDFADLALRLPNVTHVGQETDADSVYIDNRDVDLPSGEGTLSMSMKVYRDRPRGNNQTYVPSRAWTGAMSDTSGLENWIAGLAGR